MRWRECESGPDSCEKGRKFWTLLAIASIMASSYRCSGEQFKRLSVFRLNHHGRTPFR